MDYKEKLKLAKEVLDSGSYDKETIEYIFPELKESEDERMIKFIKKQLFNIKKTITDNYELDTELTKAIDWLEKQVEPTDIPADAVLDRNKDGLIADTIRYKIEKQGEQKPTEVEPKFKVGDWVMLDRPVLITKVENMPYNTHEYWTSAGTWFGDATKAKLWTIQDVKDGDVLHSTGWHNDCIFIFNGLDNWKFDEPNGDRAVATGYCCLFVSADNMEFGIQGPDCVEVNTIKPATKIQCDLLFQKMKEAGYEWDAEKKELKKISQEYPLTPDECIKSSWSEEDEKIRLWTTEYVKNLPLLYTKIEIDGEDISTKEYCDKVISWLKSIKDRVQPQPKQEWSEEDENWLYNAINVCELYNYNETAEWLKSLRPQNRDVYNPYKVVVNSIAEMCDKYKSFSEDRANDFINNIKVKCKDAKEYDSLYPQSTWKPSEKMLEALYRVIPENTMEISEDEMLLDKLYQGLKYGRVLSKK